MSDKSPIQVAGPAQRHVPALDGVRGLAVLLVLAFHLMLFNDQTGSRWWNSVGQLRGLGYLGVDLFFVLSGFLITGILYDTVGDPHYFRSFYMRRFLRIFPLYYGFLLAMILLAAAAHVRWQGRQYVLLGYMQNTGIWFPVDGFHLGRLVDLNHFWSLAVEEQFYFVWPFLVFWIRDRRRLIQLSVALSVVALALRTWLYLHATPFRLGLAYEWTLCRMDTLMIGGALALLLRGPSPRLSRAAAMAWFWATALIMAVFAVTHPGVYLSATTFAGTLGSSLCAIAFAALIFLCLDPASNWSRLFRMRWLRSLGKYSYGMYVLHILIGSLASLAMHRLLGTSLRIFLTPILHSRVLAILVEFAVTVALVYVAAFLSYNLYEAHFLWLKRYFAYRRTRPQPAQTVAAK